MAKNSHLTLVSLKVRPICPSSKPTHEHPGAEHFDMRHDFILFGRQTHIAVLAQFFNKRISYRHPCRVNTTIEVALKNLSTDTIVTTRRITVAMTSAEATTTLRADLPAPACTLNPGHEYSVVVNDDNGTLLGEHIFKLWKLTKLPTRLFKARQGFLSRHDARQAQWRHPGNDATGITIAFSITPTISKMDVPEMEIRLINPQGNISRRICTPTRATGGTSTNRGTWLVEGDFSLSPDYTGVYYAELMCFGHRFSGFLFDTERKPQTGVWKAKELTSIPRYTPEIGYDKLHTQSSNPAENNNDDVFSRLLEDFISSQTSDNSLSSDDDCQSEQSAGGSEQSTDEDMPIICETPAPPAIDMLNSLTGLDNVKQKVAEYTSLARFSHLRQQAGLPPTAAPLHSMFLGAPGTGKTTVARIMGQLLKEAGVLSKGHVVVKERATLIGQFYNSEAEKTLQALEEAQGGILFIDEAYQLHQPSDPKDPGKFVIETLLTAMSDVDNRDWMLILAGYTTPMLRMLDLNPGLRSRIPITNHYEFHNFSSAQLLEIALRHLQANRFTLGSGALEALEARITADHKAACQDETFGNGRYVMNLIETQVIPAMAMRLGGITHPSETDLSEICQADIPDITRLTLPKQVRRPLGFRA